MNSHLYTAASGLLAEKQRLELVANNLANALTPGYRPQRAFTAVFERLGRGAPPFVRAANTAVAVAGAYEKPGQGPFRETGRTLDIALPEGVLIAVETAKGRRYTRAGALGVNAAGELVDGGGRRVLGAEGKPVSGLGSQAAIAADGRVLEDEAERGRLALVRAGRGAIVAEGGNLLRAAREEDIEPVTQAELKPGWLEGSATDPLGELVELIEAQRAFETYQKLVSVAMNDVARKAVTEIAG